jgi:hypothetical protein
MILIGVWCSFQISKCYQGQSIMKASEQIGGKWLGSISHFIHGIMLLGPALLYNVETGEFFSRSLLYGNNTPTIVILMVSTLFVAMLPVSTMARYAHTVTILVLPLFLVLCMTPVMNAHWSLLYPPLEDIVWKDFNEAAATIFMIFSPLGTVTLFIHRGTKPITFSSIVVFTLVIAVFASFVLATAITTFCINTTKQLEWVSYSTLNAVRVENFFIERIVIIALLCWFFFQIVSSAFLVRCAAMELSQAFGLKFSPIWIWANMAILSVMSWVISITLVKYLYIIWIGYYAFFVLVVYPVLLYILMLLRGKGR